MIGLVVLTSAQAAPPQVSWADEVRPLLAERCLACHGPDDATRAADLRLDVPAGFTRVVDPAAPDDCELVYRVSADAGGDRMPPAGHGEPLSPDEVALLRRWVAEGAAYAPHWAYAPFAHIAVPEVRDTAWPRGPLDAFVLARLEREGLAPSAEAPAHALLRRVHLDLTGLPPTDTELAEFLADPRPDAYERRVDALLGSVHYAERMARHWLDLARYADSNGFTIDGGRSMWPWRDWVVRAYDADVPFDRFTVAQLAGDLQPGATRDDRLATGFHRNTPLNEEGGADDEENRVLAVLDRVHTTGAVWLGATLACAQCHTHKFDPITQREFFGLYAFFDQTRDSGVGAEPTMLVAATEAEERAAAQHEADEARFAAAEAAAAAASRAPFETWQPARAWASNGTKLRPEEDGSFTAVGQNAFFSTYVLEGVVRAGATPVGGLRLEALPRASLPGGGPGRGSHGNFVLQAVRVYSREAGAEAWRPVPLAAARADHEQDTRAEGGGWYPAASALAAEGPGWAIKPAFGAPHALELDLAAPLPPEAELRVELVQEHGERHTLGAFRVGLGPAGVTREPVSPAWREAAAAWLRHARSAPKLPTSLVLEERSVPRTTRRFHRGSFLDPREEIAPGFPAALAGLAPEGGRPKDRLDLARWLSDPRNALVHRVQVNRVWQQLLGRGLVATENDFGLRGARPSHPELLEWLAQDFVAHGMSHKHLVRTIVTSATYRQAATFDAALLARDPENELLARQRRLRLEGEVLRDAMLVAAGVLDPTPFGPPVQPPQPDGVFGFTQSAKTWEASPAPARYRRALYTRHWRTAPYPFHATFDAPLANATCTRRERSTSPLQALALANDPMVQDLAARLGERIQGLWSSDDRGKVAAAFRWCLAREPRPEEVDRMVQHVELVADERGGLAGWTAAARVLFGLEEFRHRP